MYDPNDPKPEPEEGGDPAPEGDSPPADEGATEGE